MTGDLDQSASRTTTISLVVEHLCCLPYDIKWPGQNLIFQEHFINVLEQKQ